MIRCPRTNCSNKTKLDPTYGILPCVSCRSKDTHLNTKRPEFYNISKQERIQRQRDEYAKDMLQPYMDSKGTPSKDFVDAYPEQRTEYFTKEQLKQI